MYDHKIITEAFNGDPNQSKQLTIYRDFKKLLKKIWSRLRPTTSPAELVPIKEIINQEFEEQVSSYKKTQTLTDEVKNAKEQLEKSRKIFEELENNLDVEPQLDQRFTLDEIFTPEEKLAFDIDREDIQTSSTDTDIDRLVDKIIESNQKIDPKSYSNDFEAIVTAEFREKYSSDDLTPDNTPTRSWSDWFMSFFTETDEQKNEKLARQFIQMLQQNYEADEKILDIAKTQFEEWYEKAKTQLLESHIKEPNKTYPNVTSDNFPNLEELYKNKTNLSGLENQEICNLVNARLSETQAESYSAQYRQSVANLESCRSRLQQKLDELNTCNMNLSMEKNKNTELSQQNQFMLNKGQQLYEYAADCNYDRVELEKTNSELEGTKQNLERQKAELMTQISLYDKTTQNQAEQVNAFSSQLKECLEKLELSRDQYEALSIQFNRIYSTLEKIKSLKKFINLFLRFSFEVAFFPYALLNYNSLLYEILSSGPRIPFFDKRPGLLERILLATMGMFLWMAIHKSSIEYTIKCLSELKDTFGKGNSGKDNSDKDNSGPKFPRALPFQTAITLRCGAQPSFEPLDPWDPALIQIKCIKLQREIDSVFDSILFESESSLTNKSKQKKRLIFQQFVAKIRLRKIFDWGFILPLQISAMIFFSEILEEKEGFGSHEPKNITRTTTSPFKANSQDHNSRAVYLPSSGITLRGQKTKSNSNSVKDFDIILNDQELNIESLASVPLMLPETKITSETVFVSQKTNQTSEKKCESGLKEQKINTKSRTREPKKQTKKFSDLPTEEFKNAELIQPTPQKIRIRIKN